MFAPFAAGLTGDKRIIISSTSIISQRYATIFADAFIQALNADAADLDKNTRISMWEAFFYASRVVMDPSGERAWVVDGNWRENGGGIYGVRIACDGTLTDEGLRVAAKLPSALAFLPGGHAVLAATDALDSPAGEDLHVLDWAAPARLGVAIEIGGRLPVAVPRGRARPRSAGWLRRRRRRPSVPVA